MMIALMHFSHIDTWKIQVINASNDNFNVSSMTRASNNHFFPSIGLSWEHMSPTNSICSQLSGFIAQLVEHCTGIAEGHGFQTPWSRLNYHVSVWDSCLNCPDKRDHHFNLSRKISFRIALDIFISFFFFFFSVFTSVIMWLVCSTPDRVVQVRGLAGDIVLCSWARHFTLTVLLSTQVYKWVPA